MSQTAITTRVALIIGSAMGIVPNQGLTGSIGIGKLTPGLTPIYPMHNSYVQWHYELYSKMAESVGGRKKSPIWAFFSLAVDTRYSVCSACEQKI